MDWDEQTVIRKSRPSAKEAKSSTAINRAMASGNFEVHKKSMNTCIGLSLDE